MRIRIDPEAYDITDHFVDHSWMLARLSSVTNEDLDELAKGVWRRRAPRRLIAAYESA